MWFVGELLLSIPQAEKGKWSVWQGTWELAEGHKIPHCLDLDFQWGSSVFEGQET